MTEAATKFEVARSKGLGGDTFTRTDRQTDTWTTDRLSMKLINPFFLKKKAGMITVVNYELS